MADRKRGMIQGGRALMAVGILALCATVLPSVGNAGVEARRIPLPVGDTVMVVKPVPLNFDAVTASHPDDGAEREARLRVLSALADRLERDDAEVAETPPPAIREIVLVPVRFRYCQTGLFGRITNAPCFERPDSTLPYRR